MPENPVVLLLDSSAEGAFLDGDLVKFIEPGGESALSSLPPLPITVLGRASLTIPFDARDYRPGPRSAYIGLVKRRELCAEHLPLKECIRRPSFGEQPQPLAGDPSPNLPGGLTTEQNQRQRQLHAAYLAWHGGPDLSRAPEEVGAFLVACRTLCASLQVPYDEPLFRLCWQSFRSPFSAVISTIVAGLAATEALKACTRVFCPLQQQLYVEALDLADGHATPPLHEAVSGQATDGWLNGSSTAAHVEAGLPKAGLDKLLNLKCCVAGAGSIGCEVLRLLALLKMGSGPKGGLHLTDPDVVRLCNLSTQSLYTLRDVGNHKSNVAAAAAKAFCPAIRISTAQNAIGRATENIYMAQFYQDLYIVDMELNSVAACFYLSDQCLAWERPLVDAGFDGTLGHVQAVVPHQTAAYSEGGDRPLLASPHCAMTMPYLPRHTVDFALAQLDLMWSDLPGQYLKDPEAFLAQAHHSLPGKIGLIERIRMILLERSGNWHQCVEWAYLKFQELFRHTPSSLLRSFADSDNYWTDRRRRPSPQAFNPEDPLHVQFVLGAATLQARYYGIEVPQDLSPLQEQLRRLDTPTLQAKRLKTEHIEAGNVPNDDQALELELRRQQQLLQPAIAQLLSVRLQPPTLDAESVTQLSFVSATALLQCRVFALPPVDTLSVKAAMSKTSTAALPMCAAVCAGFSVVEILRVVLSKNTCNTYLNLARPCILQSATAPAKRYSVRPGLSFTAWDSVLLEGDLSLGEVLDALKTRYGFVVDVLGIDTALVYASFQSPTLNTPTRMGTKLSKLYSKIASKVLPSSQKYLMLSVNGSRAEDGADVNDFPTVKLKYK
jgi:ubiquitin-activating enzyme E1